MQMPATAKLAIRRGGLTAVMGSGSGKAVEQDLFIPERNIEIGSYHLSWLLRRYSGLRPRRLQPTTRVKAESTDG